MAYKISDACVCCGACEAQCPVGAISMGDGKFEIDADKCMSYRFYRPGLIEHSVHNILYACTQKTLDFII